MSRIRTFSLLCLATFLAMQNLSAQVFTGLTAFKQIIEYEGQRFLMADVYQITSTSFDRLKIEKTITETDASEGFMFVLTSYTFNNKSGVVITSFNSTNFERTKQNFTNVHLTDQEYTELYNLSIDLTKNLKKSDDHLLKKYKDRLIVDVNSFGGYPYCTLWVDNYNRHTFAIDKWEKAYKRYTKFKNE